MTIIQQQQGNFGVDCHAIFGLVILTQQQE